MRHETVIEYLKTSYTQRMCCRALGLREAFQGVPQKLVLIIINEILKQGPEENVRQNFNITYLQR